MAPCDVVQVRFIIHLSDHTTVTKASNPAQGFKVSLFFTLLENTELLNFVLLLGVLYTNR